MSHGSRIRPNSMSRTWGSSARVEQLEARALLSASPIGNPPVLTSLAAAPVMHESIVHATATPLPDVFSVDPTALAKAKAQLAAGNAAGIAAGV